MGCDVTKGGGGGSVGGEVHGDGRRSGGGPLAIFNRAAASFEPNVQTPHAPRHDRGASGLQNALPKRVCCGLFCITWPIEPPLETGVPKNGSFTYKWEFYLQMGVLPANGSFTLLRVLFVLRFVLQLAVAI
jgi:hypothetical protein